MKNKILFLLFFPVILLGCKNSDKNFDLKTTATGIQYHFFEKSDTAYAPINGEVLLMELKYTTDKDSVVFKSGKGIKCFKTEKINNFYKGSIEEAFSMLHIGDSAIFIIRADSFYKFTLNSPIPDFAKNGRKIKFYVKLLDYIPKDTIDKEKLKWAEKKQKEELDLLNQYLEKENVKVKPTESGLYFIEQKKGTGKKINAGQKVSIHYAAYLISGELFQSSYQTNQPFEFEVGDNNIIQGLNEGITMMSKGGKSRLIIPSKLGYGAAGMKPLIYPFSTLIFDIEVIDVKN